MRLFIAVQLNEAMKDALTEVQEKMQRLSVRGNFTKRENLHITLAFIGEYPDPHDIKDIVETIDFEPFTIRLDGLGSFGSLWWAGLAGSDEMKTLANRLRRALAEEGIPYDRKKFSPHITLVRKPLTRDGRIPEDVLQNLPHDEMTVDHISLMRSERGKNGMIYTEL